ncbi:MAG: biopolymer transporter ExbD [Chitinispirillia bacterium]|jgi:biopolymer transport protein ExbD
MKNKKSILHINNYTTDEGTFRPQLTSLIDVMTILLVFLIKSFSVEGNIITPSPDLELPISSSEKPPKITLSIEISKTGILNEGTHIVHIKEFIKNDSLLIEPLYNWMFLKKSKLKNPENSREILIQSDKEIEFNIIKRVMFTCSKAGINDFSLLVIEEE